MANVLIDIPSGITSSREQIVARLRGGGLPAALLMALALTLAWSSLTALVHWMLGRDDFYGIPFALAAVVVAAWYGSLLAGIVTALASVLIIYSLLPAMRVLSSGTESTWHLIVFVAVAVAVSAFEAEQRRRQRLLEQENDRRNDFLTIVAHELRTPVTVVYGGVDVLGRHWEGLSPEDCRSMLDDMGQESTRLMRMIDDLMILARLQDDDADPWAEPVSLLKAVTAATASFQRANPQRQIELAIPEKSWTVIGRENYLQAVIGNLLSNADRFSPPNLPVFVTASRHDNTAVVSVRDLGPGVGQRQLKAIFAPFYRDPSLRDGTRGIGLGLTLCQRVVEAMGGQIMATSARNRGLIVSFSLPIIDPGLPDA